MDISIKHVLTTSLSIVGLLNNFNSSTTWRWNELLSNLNFLFYMLNNPRLLVTPMNWMLPAVNLACLGTKFQSLNLFLFSRDLPYWIMKIFTANGFTFCN
ncbi:hypothetical protein IHE45_12G034500 [Dioscorea alata]|uniref:Uncharacterized protein n=1 Tax=Dioscorea alata TaxID=55571 RepID=A0ACB7V1E5_DIOAL|nr:hypothetical protein IHE45_12G034500 [Dioscorea alata]